MVSCTPFPARQGSSSTPLLGHAALCTKREQLAGGKCVPGGLSACLASCVVTLDQKMTPILEHPTSLWVSKAIPGTGRQQGPGPHKATVSE